MKIPRLIIVFLLSLACVAQETSSKPAATPDQPQQQPTVTAPTETNTTPTAPPTVTAPAKDEANAPVKDAAATPAPDAKAVVPAPNAKATIYVYRYKQFVGSALEPSVYCDDVQLARMDNGRYFVMKVAPGHHMIRSNDKQSGIDVEFKAGQEYYVRIELATGFWKGHGRVVHVTPEQGAFEVKKLVPLGADKIVDKTLVVPGGKTGM